jgi:hypothetical protein
MLIEWPPYRTPRFARLLCRQSFRKTSIPIRTIGSWRNDVSRVTLELKSSSGAFWISLSKGVCSAGAHLIPKEGENVEEFLLNLLRTCLQLGLDSCTAEELLRLRLYYLQDLSQGEIGKMWGWHGSKVSRELRETMRRIESRTLLRLHIIDPWLTISWDDILRMCAVSAEQFF